MLKISKTDLEGVLLIEPKAFVDHRGYYLETYNEELYNKNGINIKFIQDDISVSRKDVLRGLHGDDVTWKLISCLYGEFYFVVVNCDKASKKFGKWQAFNLSDKNHSQVLVPPKHANGHLALTDTVLFHYKQSTYYNPKLQFTYLWNDPALNITWPIKNPTLSKRDTTGSF